MAVAFDAQTFSSQAGASPYTFSHTPVGTPRAVVVTVVFVTDAENVSAVTYGGVAMASVQNQVSGGGESGRSAVYFLGASIPTGMQTVSVTHTGSNATQMSAVTMTAAGDTEIGDSDFDTGTQQNASIVLTTAVSALRVGAIYTALDGLGGLTALTGMTLIGQYSSGFRTTMAHRQTTPSSGGFTFGYTTNVSTDLALVGVAVQEIQPAVGSFPQVASITVTFTSVEPHLIAMPATVNAGDLLYIAYANGHGTAPTPPAGWNLLATTPNGTRLSNFYKIANGTEGGTNQSFIDGGGGDTSAQVYRITGWHGTTPPEMPAGATGNDTNPNPPSLTASWGAADNLWLAVMACAPGSVTVSAYPSSYTNGQDDGSGTFMVASARRELNTATENPGAFTANSTLWVAQTVVVRPVSIPPVTGTLAGVQDPNVAAFTGSSTGPVPPTPPGVNRMGGTGAIRKPPRSTVPSGN